MNAFQFKYDFIKSELNPYDLLVITVLRLFDPDVFAWIAQNKSELTGDPSNLLLFDQNERDKKKKLFEEYISDLSIKSKKTEIVLTEIIATIFPLFASLIGSYRNNLVETNRSFEQTRIASWNKFDLYFTLSLDTIVIPLKEILKAINEFNQDDFQAYLENLFKNNLAVYFLKEFKKYINELNEDRIKMIVKLIFNNCYRIIRESGKTIFEVYEFSYQCLHCCTLLLENLSDNKMHTIEEILENDNQDVLQLFIDYLWQIEYKLKLLDKNAYEKPEDILLYEKLIIPKLRKYADTKEIFNLPSVSKRFIRLWFGIDKEESEKYIKEYIQDPLRFIKLIAFNVERSHGSNGSKWTVSSSNILNEESIRNKYSIHDIKAMHNIEGFTSLPIETQQAFAAYILWLDKEVDCYGDVLERSVTELLEGWETNS